MRRPDLVAGYDAENEVRLSFSLTALAPNKTKIRPAFLLALRVPTDDQPEFGEV